MEDKSREQALDDILKEKFGMKNGSNQVHSVTVDSVLNVGAERTVKGWGIFLIIIGILLFLAGIILGITFFSNYEVTNGIISIAVSFLVGIPYIVFGSFCTTFGKMGINIAKIANKLSC